jgi:hypothetical protein
MPAPAEAFRQHLQQGAPVAVASQAIEAQPSFGQIRQGEAVWPARRTASSGQDVADVEYRTKQDELRAKNLNPDMEVAALCLDHEWTTGLPREPIVIGRRVMGNRVRPIKGRETAGHPNGRSLRR